MTTSTPYRETLGYVDESDLDLVLLLDARVAGALTQHLAHRAGLTITGPTSATRSASRCGGARETDVEIRWAGSLLLVEDKIDSDFTPGQPESYVQEVESRTAQGEQAVAVLVCPERSQAKYQAIAGDAFVYVTCEELADVAEAAGSAASIVFRAAAERRPVRACNPVAHAWGEAYRAVVDAETTPTCLALGPTVISAIDSDWIKFNLAGMPSWSRGLYHWLSRSRVVLYVDLAVDVSSVPLGVTVRKCPKSWCLELSCLAVTLDRDPSKQVEGIRDVVSAALHLCAWARSVEASARRN